MSEETTTLGVDDSLLESAARCLDMNSVRALSELQLGEAARARLDVLAQKAMKGNWRRKKQTNTSASSM